MNSLLLTDSTIANNTGPVAAGIYNNVTGTMVITDSTITRTTRGAPTASKPKHDGARRRHHCWKCRRGLVQLGLGHGGRAILADNTAGNCAGATQQGPAFSSLGYNLTNNNPSGTVFCGFTQSTDRQHGA